MRISSRLRTILVCGMLEFAALTGMPMRPDEIKQLLRTMNQPKLAHVLRDENNQDDEDPGTGFRVPGSGSSSGSR